MKCAHRREPDEGWLLTVILCLILAVCAAVYVNRLPRKMTAEPVCFIDRPLNTAAPEPVDINSADADALKQLPGIGDTLAERIIAYREKNGFFAGTEELLLVDGIGEGKLEDIRDYISCQNP